MEVQLINRELLTLRYHGSHLVHSQLITLFIRVPKYCVDILIDAEK